MPKRNPNQSPERSMNLNSGPATSISTRPSSARSSTSASWAILSMSMKSPASLPIRSRISTVTRRTLRRTSMLMYSRSFSRARAQESGAMLVENSRMISLRDILDDLVELFVVIVVDGREERLHVDELVVDERAEALRHLLGVLGDDPLPAEERRNAQRTRQGRASPSRRASW